MNEIIEKEEIKIENMIYEIRGVQVMLDSDLAKLYQCKNGTKSINLAVKRHIRRFPKKFMFQLTKDEYYKILRFQFETLELEQGKYSKYLPYVFTKEQDAIRYYLIDNKDIYKSLSNINNKLIEHDEKLDYIFSKFDKKELN